MVLISGLPLSRVPVRAVTVTTEVIEEPELVMNCLAPSTTHSSPSRTALVAVAPASDPAPGSVGEPALLLLVGAVGEDRVDAQADGGLERDPDRLVDAAELLDRDAERDEVTLTPAVRLGGGQAEQAQLTHLVNHVDGEVMVAVPLRGMGRDLLLGEVTDDSTQLFVLGLEKGGHAPQVSAY